MANDELHFWDESKPDFRYEEIQFFFRKHWLSFLEIVFFGLFIGFLLFIVILGFYEIVEAVGVAWLRLPFVFITAGLTFLYFNFFFLRVINYFFDLVIVTTHRVIITRKTVFLRNDSGAIDLTKIQDLTVEARGLLSNYLQYGRLLITLSASVPPVLLDFVPRPHDILERTNRVKREHILNRQERRLKTDYLQDIRHLVSQPDA